MIELRKMPVTMSPAPATPRVINDKPSESERPKTTIAAPPETSSTGSGGRGTGSPLRAPRTPSPGTPPAPGRRRESQDERSMDRPTVTAAETAAASAFSGGYGGSRSLETGNERIHGARIASDADPLEADLLPSREDRPQDGGIDVVANAGRAKACSEEEPSAGMKDPPEFGFVPSPFIRGQVVEGPPIERGLERGILEGQLGRVRHTEPRTAMLVSGASDRLFGEIDPDRLETVSGQSPDLGAQTASDVQHRSRSSEPPITEGGGQLLRGQG
jgi:hypothetical protein